MTGYGVPGAEYWYADIFSMDRYRLFKDLFVFLHVWLTTCSLPGKDGNLLFEKIPELADFEGKITRFVGYSSKTKKVGYCPLSVDKTDQ